MKKIYIVAVVMLLIISVMMFTACNTDQGPTDYKDMKYGEAEQKIAANIYAELEIIGRDYKDRSFGKVSEQKFAEYLTQRLGDLGYTDESGEAFTYSNQLNLNSEEKLTSKNIVFKKDAPNTDKAVLITSQIDNMKSYEGYNDEGIYAGATGVAIMLELAESIKDMTLPYDVYFVGFGANSMSLAGAGHFYDKFYVNHQKEDTLLMVDLSKPIGGDHMYMYTDEVDTIHGKYLSSIAMNANMDFRPVPSNKQEMDITLVSNQKVPYTHAGIMSSNIFFVSARIPSVNFLSVNWEAHTTSEVLERAGRTNIASTSRDNFEFFTTEWTNKENIMKESYMVYATIMSCFMDEQFMPTMMKSIENMPDYSIWSSSGLLVGVRISLAVIIIVAAVLISSKFRKGLPMLPMEQFMSDIGMQNAGMNMPRPDIDPFGEEQTDPFKGVDEEFKRQENEKKKDDDGSSDIFGI